MRIRGLGSAGAKIYSGLAAVDSLRGRLMHPQGTREIQATLRVFGFEDTRAHLSVLPRSTPWRAARAGTFAVAGVFMAPVVALVPPHAAWGLAAVVTGCVLAARKWGERFTLLELEGPCPRCGSALAVATPTRLRDPWTVDCEACHHQATLTVDGGLTD